MVKVRQETQPDRKRYSCISSLEISNVDKDKNTINMTVNGYHVTAVFQPEANAEVYETIRKILINQLLDGI